MTAALGVILAVPVASPARAGAPDAGTFATRITGDGTSFSEPTNVSDGASGFSHVDADGGAVHVVWDTDRQPREVKYRRGDGSEFSKVTNLTDNPGDSSESDLLVAGDAVHVVWEDDLLDDRGKPDPCCLRQNEIYYRASGDGGDSFGEPVNLSDSRTRHSKDPDIAGSGEVVAVVFEEAVSDSNDDIIVRVSRDGGATWENDMNLSQDKDQTAEPSVSVFGDEIHVVFEDRRNDADLTDDRLAYVRSTDAGRTFSEPVLLPRGAERRGVVAVVEEVVFVAGCSRSDAASSELFGYRSTNGGSSWRKAENLSENAGQCGKPAIDASGDLVVIAWQDTTPGENDIFVRASSNGGRKFGRILNVSETTGPSEDPSLSIDAITGDVHVVWTERR